MILYDLGENSRAVIPWARFQETHNKLFPKDKETNGNSQLKAGPAYSLRLDAIHRVVGVSLEQESYPPKGWTDRTPSLESKDKEKDWLGFRENPDNRSLVLTKIS